MFICKPYDKIFQTLPGNGWKALVDWSLDSDAIADGAPTTTLEPVVSWVTIKTQNRKTLREDVIIAALVRSPLDGSELILLTPSAPVERYVYLAPGEELKDRHLTGDYAEAVTRESL